MKVLVIGACGHIGSYLIKQLVNKNHQVYAVSRGGKTPYGYDEKIWNKVNKITMSRGELINSDLLKAQKFDAICDLIAFGDDDVKAVVSKITPETFYLAIGSIWTYGNRIYSPIDENHPKNSFTFYGINKGKMEEYILRECKAKNMRGCIVHPGHISGKEWSPVNPQGNEDDSVFTKLIKGEEISLPFLGSTYLQHIHSKDLATIILACLEKQDVANGEAFIAGVEKPMCLRDICNEMYRHYGNQPKLKFPSWSDYVKEVGEENALVTLDHAIHSPYCSMDKVKKLLNVKLEYSILDILYEYVSFNGLDK